MGGHRNPRYVELRVHGVAGTPPESMLGLKAVPINPPGDACGHVPEDLEGSTKVQIYGLPDVAPEVQAFSWSSLTSGSAITALWILLLPFMLANVAGWAMVPLKPPKGAERSPALRWIALLVRLGAVTITAIYAVAFLLIFVDLVGYQALAKGHGYQLGPALGVAATAALIAVLGLSTLVRRRPDAPAPWPDASDPVGTAWLDDNQRAMWNSPGIISRLHRLHLGTALGLTACLSMLSLRGTSAEWNRIDDVIVIGAALSILLCLGLLAGMTLSSGRNLAGLNSWIRWVAWILPSIAVAGAIWRYAATDLTSESARTLPGIRGSGAWLAISLVVLVAAGLIAAAVGRNKSATPKRSSWNQASLLLTGATVAMLYGIGFAVQATRFFGDEECIGTSVHCKPVVGDLIDWISVGFTLMLTVLLWVLGIKFALAYRNVTEGDGRFMRALRVLTDNVSTILAWLAWIGLSGVAAAIAIGGSNGFGHLSLPGGLQLALTVAFALPFVVAALATVRRLRWWLQVVTVLAFAGAFWAFTRGWTIEVIGTSLPPHQYISLARLVAISLPTSLLVGRLVGSLRNRNTRRGVAILWDLGNFWPRWFHPFAPPTYSDTAVTKLTSEVQERLREGGAVLLAPHSQGSIIGAAAVLNLDDALTERLALLSYGSPLSRLYAQAFPALYTEDALNSICAKLTAQDGPIRWRNLFRESDPIGGNIVATPPLGDRRPPTADEIDVGPEPDECHRKHSDYPAEAYYVRAAERLRELIT